MKIEHNVELKNKTTFKIGGIANNFYIPENEKDLLEIVKKNSDFLILSGGSNLLINDKKNFENIIYMTELDNSITDCGNGLFYIGASNRIQKVIRYVNNLGYGGIEELFGLPAMFGGIIYMNAGIGGRDKIVFNISEFVKRVKVLDIQNKQIRWLKKEECDFSYRKSIFQRNEYIIIGAEIQLYKQNKEISSQRIEKRLKYCREKQERSGGTFGSCFCISSYRILQIVSKLKSKKGGIKFSNNNKNWLINDGTGTFEDTMNIIKTCKNFHKLFHRKIECEVIIWE